MVKCKEVYKHWLPRLLKAEAVTLGSTIYYRRAREYVAPRWHIHEQMHVEQYNKYGIIGFLFIYLIEYIYGRFKGLDHYEAYKEITFEVQARMAERGHYEEKRDDNSN